MDLRSINQLLAHSPWSEHEHQEARGKVTREANLAFRMSKRKVDLLFAGAAACAGLGLLRLLTGTGSEAAQLIMLVAGVLVGYVALRAAYGRTSVAEAVSRWEAEEGVDPLTPVELEALRSLAAARVEALQRVTAWQALGLVLRRRDRRAVEEYLASQGVAVPARQQPDAAGLEAGIA
jgi:hypothetical protein